MSAHDRTPEQDLEARADLFKALGHPARLLILNLEILQRSILSLLIQPKLLQCVRKSPCFRHFLSRQLP